MDISPPILFTLLLQLSLLDIEALYTMTFSLKQTRYLTCYFMESETTFYNMTLFHDPARIAYRRFAGGNILCDDRACPDNRVFTDDD